MENYLKKCFKPVFITWIISVLCYITLISNGLTNSVDGLWACSYYQSGNIELTSGRWALLFLDKARGAYGAEPFSTLISLLIMSFGTYIVINMFMDSNYRGYMYSMLILCSVTLCCILAYRFTSINYSIAYLAAILSAKLLIDDEDFNKLKIIVAIALLITTIGIYQMTLGCFFVVVIMYMMKQLLNNENARCFKLLLKTIVTFIVSCIFYKIAWEICLALRHVTASNYRGADSVSVLGILKGFPSSCIAIYSSWVRYFSFREGNYILSPIRALIVEAIFVAVIYVGARKLGSNLKNCILYILLVLCLPLGANVALILAPGNSSVQMHMTEPMLLAMLLAFCFLDGTNLIKKRILEVLTIILLYGNVFAVGTDIDSLSQGRETSCAIMNNIIFTLNQKGLLSDKYEYAFYGNIAANELFNTNENYERASYYARYGSMMTKPDMMHKTYMGLFDEIGIDIQSVDNDKYYEVLNEVDLDKLGTYPEEDSIIVKDDVVIVKVSDDYLYD